MAFGRVNGGGPTRSVRRRAPRVREAIWIGVLSTTITVTTALAQPQPVQVRSRCHDCHLNPDPPEGTRRGPLIDPTAFRQSVHGEQRCEGCHRDVVDIPHPTELSPVDCRDCHRIGNTSGAPQLRSYREYENSVHGQLVAENDPRAPRCQNCHGKHDILRATEEGSHVNRIHLAETCGQCHKAIENTYEASIHGTALMNGDLLAPVCTDCHGEHFIQRHLEPISTVARGHVVETCSNCHEDIARMKQAGVSLNVVETYRDSYHGVAAKFGSSQTATCIDCHGHHDIEGPADPASRVNPANLPTTCGQSGCHPGAGPGFARGRIHVSFHGGQHAAEEPPIAEGRDRTVAKVFKGIELAFIALTTVVIFGMILYMALDLYHRWVRLAGKRLRYFAVATIPLAVTFWTVWRVILAFIDKVRS